MTNHSPESPAVAGRTAQHATFVIDRTFEASPAQVFNAFADPTEKARWFVGPESWRSSDHSLDFRVGGREHLSSLAPNGVTHVYGAIYQDIVPDRRIVSSYEMHLGEQRISVSLSTIELIPEGDHTRLILTEQDAFLDGTEVPGDRERGTHELLDNLAAELRRADPTSHR
jgi:uncharacterized protein YndB with AHSA1/START domain